MDGHKLSIKRGKARECSLAGWKSQELKKLTESKKEELLFTNN